MQSITLTMTKRAEYMDVTSTAMLKGSWNTVHLVSCGGAGGMTATSSSTPTPILPPCSFFHSLVCSIPRTFKDSRILKIIIVTMEPIKSMWHSATLPKILLNIMLHLWPRYLMRSPSTDISKPTFCIHFLFHVHRNLLDITILTALESGYELRS